MDAQIWRLTVDNSVMISRDDKKGRKAHLSFKIKESQQEHQKMWMKKNWLVTRVALYDIREGGKQFSWDTSRIERVRDKTLVKNEVNK